MKKIINKFVIVLMATFFVSCEKKLDLVPLDNISEEVFFKAPDDFRFWANQYYGSLTLVYVSNTEDWADLTTGSGGNSVSRGEHQVSDYSNTWSGNYRLIRNANILIEKYEEAGDEHKSSVQQFAGEAYFFRGWAYFNLVVAFGDVPLINESLDTSSEAVFSARSDRKEVIKQAISDLNMAADLCSVESSLTATDKGRISQGAALAYKSRVALFEGTWQKFHNGSDSEDFLGQAMDAADKVISSDEYELFYHPAELGDYSYKYLFMLDKVKTNPSSFTKADNKESILKRAYDADLRESPRQAASLVGEKTPTRKMADMYLCLDGLPINQSALFGGKDGLTTEFKDRDYRMMNTFQIPGERYHSSAQAIWNKDWSNPDDPLRGYTYTVEFGARTITGYSTFKFNPEVELPVGVDYPVIRYAEVLLNYIEAVYEKEGAVSDAELNRSINLTRERGGLPALTNAFILSNSLSIREEIRRERAVELFYEGFRYNDLRRWKTAETEIPNDLLGVKYLGTEWETHEWTAGFAGNFDAEGYILMESAAQRTFDPEKHYLFPLPRRELQLNENLVQNPKW